MFIVTLDCSLALQKVTMADGGPYRKWDIDPETFYLDDLAARIEELEWNGQEEENTAQASKRQRYQDSGSTEILDNQTENEICFYLFCACVCLIELFKDKTFKFVFFF